MSKMMTLKEAVKVIQDIREDADKQGLYTKDNKTILRDTKADRDVEALNIALGCMLSVELNDVMSFDCKSQKEMDDLVKQIRHTKGMHWTEVLWEPVEDDNGEDIIRFLSELPEDGEEVIMTDGKNLWVDLWEDAWGFESTEVTLRKGRLFWMSFPEPYKVEGGK